MRRFIYVFVGFFFLFQNFLYNKTSNVIHHALQQQYNRNHQQLPMFIRCIKIYYLWNIRINNLFIVLNLCDSNKKFTFWWINSEIKFCAFFFIFFLSVWLISRLFEHNLTLRLFINNWFKILNCMMWLFIAQIDLETDTIAFVLD